MEKVSAAPETAEVLLEKLQILADANELATAPEWNALKARWNALPRTPEETARFDALGKKLEERFAAEAAHDDVVRARAGELLSELEALCEAGDIGKLRAGKAEIDKALAALGRLPKETAKRCRELRRRASEAISLHFDTLDYARWESYTLKLDVFSELEKLLLLEGPALVEAAKKLRELREKWKNLGSVPKEKLDESNEKFLALTRNLQHKIDEYFSGRRQAQKESAAAKTALCDEAEKLASSTDWRTASERFKAMQTQWKSLPQTGHAETELFARFRRASDAFFSARSAFYAELETRYAAAIRAREALISEAKALKPGDVRAAKALREKFNASLHAGRDEIALRKRFDEAMEAFFSARHEETVRRDAECDALLAEWKTLIDHPLESAARAREIAERLHLLANRRTFAEEKKLKAAFDAAFSKAQSERALHVREESEKCARAWLALYLDFRAGKKPENLPDAPENLPRVAPVAKAIAAAISGDGNAVRKVEKQLLAAQNEAEKLLDALENAAGCKDSAPKDLAAELEAAILGNSGFGASRRETTGWSRDAAAFESILWLPEETRAALQPRFEAVKAKLTVSLKNGEKK